MTRLTGSRVVPMRALGDRKVVQVLVQRAIVLL